MVPVRPARNDNIDPQRHRLLRLGLVVILFSSGLLFIVRTHGGSDGILLAKRDTAAPEGVMEEVTSPETMVKKRNQVLLSSNNKPPPSTVLLSKNREELDEVDVDPLKITSGSVNYNTKTLSYYHCGPLPSSSAAAAAAAAAAAHDDDDKSLDINMSELVLLHGAAFTKEEWKTSNILQMLCEINNEEDEGDLSILALDLPVTADGMELGLAFDSLVSGGVLTGRPVTIITPSASGKSVLSLGEMNSSSGSSNSNELLTRIIKAWIPVASFAVLKASESTLVKYKNANIPILSIHGDEDEAGKKVTERLKEVSNANGVELGGRHPVYLDSPEEFVQEVMQFLDVMNL